MPPPDRMLATIRKAIAVAPATPGRSGHLVRLADCSEVIVAGDLHGHLANFQAVLKAADLNTHPRRHLVMQEVVHSPFLYPGGGDKSHQLLDLYAALKCQYPGRVHLIPGNHEVAQWTGRAVGKGDATQNDAFRLGVEAAYGPAAAEIYAAYMTMLQGLPLALKTPNDVFVSHSLPPGRSMPTFDARRFEETTYPDADYQPGGFVYGVVWGRDTSHQNVDDYLRKVDADWLVSGHIPTDDGFLVPNHRQVIVDCAAAPAAFIRIDCTHRLTLTELVAGVVVI